MDAALLAEAQAPQPRSRNEESSEGAAAAPHPSAGPAAVPTLAVVADPAGHVALYAAEGVRQILTVGEVGTPARFGELLMRLMVPSYPGDFLDTLPDGLGPDGRLILARVLRRRPGDPLEEDLSPEERERDAGDGGCPRIRPRTFPKGRRGGTRVDGAGRGDSGCSEP